MVGSTYRQPVVGWGPHVVRHGLGRQHVIVVAYNDALQALPCRIELTDSDTCEVEVGYWSVPEGAWVPGCAGDAVVHILVNA